MKVFESVPIDIAVVSSQPDGLWTRVCRYVDGPGLLRISADPQGRWSYAAGTVDDCGPEGDPLAFVSRNNCLSQNAPVGALIGKIGGSSAGIGDAPVFAVGSCCVVRIPDDGGPLFLTINDTVDGMSNNGGTMKILDIGRADAPAAPPAASPPAPAGGVTNAAT